MLLKKILKKLSLNINLSKLKIITQDLLKLFSRLRLMVLILLEIVLIVKYSIVDSSSRWVVNIKKWSKIGLVSDMSLENSTKTHIKKEIIIIEIIKVLITKKENTKIKNTRPTESIKMKKRLKQSSQNLNKNNK